MRLHEHAPGIGRGGKSADQQDAGPIDRAVQGHPVGGVNRTASAGDSVLEGLGT